MNFRIPASLVLILVMSATSTLGLTSSKSKTLHFRGNIRSYYFTRSFRQGTNQAAFSLGGNFHLNADNLIGRFGVGATYGTANPLGLNGSNAKKVDPSLPGSALSVLEEAYLQYNTDYETFRLGRQNIATPWAQMSDTRIIPNSFQGVLASANISKSWSFTADRMVRFKSRVSPTFDANDLLSKSPTAGMLAVGAVYSQARTTGQAWYYNFYGTARMAYIDVTQRFSPACAFKPYIGAQYAAEAGDTLRLNNNVNGHAFGVNLGITHDQADLSFSYNDMPFKKGFYKNGGIASPYTYADTDPLYTTSMNTGLVDQGAGHAYKIAGTVWSYHNRLRGIASRAELYLYGSSIFPNNHVLDTNLDFTYFMGNDQRGNAFRGVSIRDRWSDIETPGLPFTFINNRTQLEFDF